MDTKRKQEKALASASLASFSKRLGGTKSLRKGVIAFNLTGENGGDYWLDPASHAGQVFAGSAAEKSVIQVIGDANQILAILEGRLDARTQYAEGGLLVQGDLRYLSDLALEMGIIKRAL